MRRNLTVLVIASTSAVVLALVIPLTLLVGRLAQDRAVSAATQQAQSVALLIAIGTTGDQLAGALAQSDQRTGLHTSVVPPTGTVLGPAVDSTQLARARGGEAFTLYPGSGPDGAEVYLPVAATSGTSVVRVAVSGADLHQGVASARILLVALAAGLVGASVLAAVLLSRRLTAPLLAVADVAHDLRGGDLDRRVVPDGPSEVREVGDALNQLAGRIGELLQSEREAAADLSHRLRTPVTALRLAVDTTPDPTERARLREHVERLEVSVDGVVRQSRQPRRPGTDQPATDLSAVVTERVEFWSALAQDQGREVRTEIAAGATLVPIAEQDLVDLLDVVLDNVFAHTPEGTGFGVRVVRAAAAGSLVIEDDGPGLPPTHALGRGRSQGGSTGLGLDIVSRLAGLSGAEVDLGPSAHGTGARVSVTWPCLPTRPADLQLPVLI